MRGDRGGHVARFWCRPVVMSKRKLDFFSSLQVSTIIKKKVDCGDKVKCISNRFKSREKKLRLRKILNVVFPSAAAGWAIKSNGDVFPRVVAANHLSCCLS